MVQSKIVSKGTNQIKIKVEDHLIIPFGGPKWDIEKIKIIGVSTEATYFESETPCVYINKTKEKPLTLQNIKGVFPEEFSIIEDSLKAYNFVRDHIKKYTDQRTEFENRFL